MWIALAIIVCMALHLVDRNQKWATVWKFTKRTALALMLIGILGASYVWYDNSRVQANQGWVDYQPPAR